MCFPSTKSSQSQIQISASYVNEQFFIVSFQLLQSLEKFSFRTRTTILSLPLRTSRNHFTNQVNKDNLGDSRSRQIYNVMFDEQISFKEVIFASSNLMKEIVKAVVTKFLIQIKRSKIR